MRNDRTSPKSLIRRGRVAAWGFMMSTTLLALWALGPRPTFVEAWEEPELPDDLDAWLAEREHAAAELREGAGKGIVWVDTDAKARTELSLVYLHGFSADRNEMEPVISQLGKELGANVYFTRLSGHGRDGYAMAEATVEDWLVDVAEAFAVGKRIGKNVVVIGSSTGGTLATWIATRTEVDGYLAAIVLVSPNFHPKDRKSRIFLQPWGESLARLLVGSERCWEPMNEEQARHWTFCYPIEAITPMMALVERVRTMDVSSISVPTLVIYSKDDAVVDARETVRRLSGMIGTHVSTANAPASTDPERHVLAGDIVSPASNDQVRHLMADFLREKVIQANKDSEGSTDE